MLSILALLLLAPPAASQTAQTTVTAPAAQALELRIPSEPGVTLAATLHLPAARPGQRHPLAVVIQGHGRNGRRGYVQIIQQLNASGIAAIEYDKRGINQSTGTYEENIERLTADATAVVAAMRARADIDPARIALIGHSQGGVIAPAVAAADPRIAAVITLAGSVGDGLPYLRRALRSQLLAAGRPAATVDPAADAAAALLQARIDCRDDDATIATSRAAVVTRLEASGFSRAEAEEGLAMIDTPEAWTINKLRSASDLKALRIPVLAIFAGRDPLVVAEAEAPAARIALANNPKARVVVLDGLSHWFQDNPLTGREDEVARLGPNASSPRVITLIDTWLRDALTPSRPVATRLGGRE
jgi:pimeloyl-ACP methyl ester carboxylesterase